MASGGGLTAVERVRTAYRRIRDADRSEVWIALRSEDDALVEALAVDERVAAGERPALAGFTLAIKDNIDVAGLQTTAACPAFSYMPVHPAPAVQRLVDAGAIVLGKTNLDQFATGLVGTRSPYGAVRAARRPEYVSGGSSSGSAVAVALGIADVALGTDTAGSGRVPAAFAGIVGLKPTRGLVPTRGVVPACRTLDCVTVFARDLGDAEAAFEVLVGPDPDDPGSRSWSASSPLAAPPAPRVGVPTLAALQDLTPAARQAFAEVAKRLQVVGAQIVPIDITELLDAGRLLYDGAFVAERFAAVGEFAAAHPNDVDPVVGAILAAAANVPAHALVNDVERIDVLRLRFRKTLEDLDAVLVPTTTAQPTIADVLVDPVGANNRLGVYTMGANLLDLCAVAVPAGEADGGYFGVSLLGAAFSDRVVTDVARLLEGTHGARRGDWPPGVDLFVVGAHRSGQPLNGELTARGARLVGVVKTAPLYRLHCLETDPKKPGLQRVDRGGQTVEGELWRVSPTGIAELLLNLPSPMALGAVQLASGRTSVGFVCEPIALAGAVDITVHGSWPAYMRGDDPTSNFE